MLMRCLINLSVQYVGRNIQPLDVTAMERCLCRTWKTCTAKQPRRVPRSSRPQFPGARCDGWWGGRGGYECVCVLSLCVCWCHVSFRSKARCCRRIYSVCRSMWYVLYRICLFFVLCLPSVRKRHAHIHPCSFPLHARLLAPILGDGGGGCGRLAGMRYRDLQQRVSWCFCAVGTRAYSTKPLKTSTLWAR